VAAVPAMAALKEVSPVSLMKLALSGLVLFCFLAVSAHEARADAFTILPGGNLVFNLNATTQVSFVCHPTAPCAASGNSVTFGDGANTTTFTFTGSVLNTTVRNVSVPLTLATIQTTITGTGYVNPVSVGGIASPLGFLTITLSQTSPTAVTRSITPILSGGPNGYRLSFGSDIPGVSGGTFFATPTGPNPPGYNYTAIGFSFPSTINIPVGSTTNISPQVGAVPEPATMLLFGAGLAGIVGAARRKRKARGGPTA
jgi:hypothetical protein